jgi:hypothetical protein
MKAPTFHLPDGNFETAAKSACGKKKGLIMEEAEFKEKMKDGFESLFLCDSCIKIAKSLKSKRNAKA